MLNNLYPNWPMSTYISKTIMVGPLRAHVGLVLNSWGFKAMLYYKEARLGKKGEDFHQMVSLLLGLVTQP